MMPDFEPSDYWRAVAALERVRELCEHWEQAETWDGREEIVSRAFGLDLRRALEGSNTR